MRVLTTELDGVVIIEPKIFTDPRGYFYESFQAERYQQHGIAMPFVQDNVSHSVKNVVRGLHYQLQKPQGKLVYVFYGSVLDVAVDIRVSSPTFGKIFYTELSAENHRQIYIPPGFAHGFCVLSDTAGFIYKCTDYYDPVSERGVIWNDPDLMIPWPVKDPILVEKDKMYSRLKDISDDQLFK
jgi:dTDP-4-dehydrorhamnose 3,5-epimerase